MTKEQFMTELESRLQDISYDERQAALRYYEEYFEEAGEDEESMGQLESPEDIAKAIKEDIDIKLQLVRSSQKKEGNSEKKEEKKEPESTASTSTANEKTVKIILIVVACLIFSPVLFGFACAIFGLLMGAIATVFGLTMAGVGILIAGVVVFGTGIATLFTLPIEGLLLCGVGLFLLGLGCLFVWLSVWFWGTALPELVKLIKHFCKWIAGKTKGVTA